MKRNLIILGLVVLVAAAGIWLMLSKDKNPFVRDAHVYSAVPVSSPFFFEFTSLQAVSGENSFLSELKSAEIGTEWFAFLNHADSLIEASHELPRSLRNSSFLLAYGIAGRNELVPLFITRSGSKNRQEDLTAFIHTLYPPGTHNYTSRNYSDHTIHETSDAANHEVLFFSFADGIMIASSRAIIIEQVLRQLSVQGIHEDPYFQQVSEASGGDNVSLFINHNWVNSFFAGFLNRSSKELVDEFGATKRIQYSLLAEKFRSFSAWSQFGFQFDENRLMLTGTSAADDSLNHFLTVFDGQQPARSHTAEVLPANTSFFCSYLFPNKNGFFERLEDHYMHSPAYYQREERMKRFDGGFRSNTRKVFQGIVKQEAIVAATTIPVDPANKTTYFLIQVQNRSEAEEQLRNLISNYAGRNDLQLQDFTSEFAATATTYPVYRFPYPSFPGLWLGSPFEMAEARFVVLYEEWLVFSNFEQGIHDYLRSRLNGSTLERDTRYQRFAENAQGKSNIKVFADINRTFSLRNDIFSATFVKQIDKREERIRGFGKVYWEIQHEKGDFKNFLVLDYQKEQEGDAQTTWQSEVGSNCAGKPLFVVNHSDPANREIIFQDTQNNLHLVAHTGRVRWSVPLSGKIMGEIHQVDILQNGRLQYLFNTKDKLYVIDRNGNSVSPFPVTLKSPATNGVNVFDYHSNRDYRYFVAGEDRKVYVYDSTGKTVTGWKFGQTQSAVTTPVQHFKVGGKDYIVFKDETDIYIQDRQGETRVPVINGFNFSKNPLYFSPDGVPKIIASEASGKVFYIYFDGKVEEKKTARFSENHFFTVEDLNGNGVPDFVFTDGSELTAMEENGKKLFGKKLDNPLSPPNVYTFAEGIKKVGVTDEGSNRIYLFDSDGKLHSGFPLQGNSEFSIGKLSENSTNLNLVVGSDGGKLYNYTLN